MYICSVTLPDILVILYSTYMILEPSLNFINFQFQFLTMLREQCNTVSQHIFLGTLFFNC